MISRAPAILACLALAASRAVASSSDDWEVLGIPGFSAGEVICCQIAVDAQGVVHVAYQDQALGSNPASVQRFTGGAWTYLGAEGSASFAQAWYNHVAFDSAGTVLVASRDYGVGGRLNVRRFVPGASAWSNLGTWGPSAGEAHYTDIATRADGEVFVVFADRTTSPADRATAMRWSGAAWSVLGVAGFSAGAAEFTSLALDPAGEPWVAYSDSTQGGKASVMRWDAAGGAWEPAGPAGFTTAPASNVRLAFDRAGVPWIVWHQYHTQIVAMRFDGSQWVQVGGPASADDRPTVETEGWRQWLSLAFDSQNAPHVAYQLLDVQARAAVRRFDGSQWDPVGSTGFTPPDADYMAMALDAHDVPYVVFRDSSAGRRATVMRYAPSPHVYGSLQPSAIGCVARISAAASASATAAEPCDVRGIQVPSERNGMLLYGYTPAHTPFQGGFLLLAPPLRRTFAQSSGGTAGGGDCTGGFSTDFNAIVQAGLDPGLQPGAVVFAQYWYRDPAGVGGVALTNAVRLDIGL